MNKRYRQDEEPQDPYDLPEGDHEVMTLGGLTFFRHDYDGPVVHIVDHGAGLQADGAYPGWAIHAKDLEETFWKFLETAEEVPPRTVEELE